MPSITTPINSPGTGAHRKRPRRVCSVVEMRKPRAGGAMLKRQPEFPWPASSHQTFANSISSPPIGGPAAAAPSSKSPCACTFPANRYQFEEQCVVMSDQPSDAATRLQERSRAHGRRAAPPPQHRRAGRTFCTAAPARNHHPNSTGRAAMAVMRADTLEIRPSIPGIGPRSPSARPPARWSYTTPSTNGRASTGNLTHELAHGLLGHTPGAL